MTYNADSFKVRCSCIHAVLANSRSNPQLTELQAKELSDLEDKETLTIKQTEKLAELLVKKENGKKVILSDTCISYLMEEYAWQTEGMVRVTKEIMDVPQLRKGKLVEADSLILLSYVDQVAYIPNINEAGERERVFNDYLSGEVDAYVGKSIMEAEVIPDVKSIWDYPTFLDKIHAPLTTANDKQVKGYMDITGAPKGFIANCLITNPHETIEKIKYRLLSKMNVATEESPEFKELYQLIERSMKFDHIPAHKRVFKKNVDPMTSEERNILYDRVKVCREWLIQFHEQYEKLNKP